MKRLVSLLFVLAAVVTALVLTSPAPAEAAPPGCFCGGYFYTPQTWGQGDTCAEAEADLRAKAYAQVDCFGEPYGTCSRQLVITAGCHWDGYSGKFQMDGYVRYACWFCDEY